MDPATIMVLVLSAGVLALLVWFEINSRRNEVRKKQAGNLDPTALDASPKETESKARLETEKRKAA